MFRYVYEIAPIDYFDGTMLIGDYIDGTISDLSQYKDKLLNVPEWHEKDNGNINFCNNIFGNVYMGDEHVFNRLKRIGKEIEYICGYFNKKNIRIEKKRIRVFSVPNEESAWFPIL